MKRFNILQAVYTPANNTFYTITWRRVSSVLAATADAALKEALKRGYLLPVVGEDSEQVVQSVNVRNRRDGRWPPTLQ